MTLHFLRHYCASQLYVSGMDLVAIQEVLGHGWIATIFLHYIHGRDEQELSVLCLRVLRAALVYVLWLLVALRVRSGRAPRVTTA